MPSVAIKGHKYKSPLLSLSEKAVLLKNHPQEGWPGSASNDGGQRPWICTMRNCFSSWVVLSHRENENRQER